MILKILTGILFSVMVSTIIVAVKAPPSDPNTFFTPTVFASIIAGWFMLAFLQALKRSE